MNKRILKINAWLLMIIGIVLMLLFVFSTVYSISIPSDPNSWEDLGKFIMIIATVIVCLINLPSVISGIGTLNYLRGKNTYKLCMVFDVIGIILYSLFGFLFIYTDIFGIFNDFYNGNANTRLMIIFSTIIFVLFICPLIINILELYKVEKKINYKELLRRYRFVVIGIVSIILIIGLYKLFTLRIINDNKIGVTKDTLYSYSDFKTELETRDLIYKLPENKSELTSPKTITALDSSSKYGYSFSSGTYTDSSMLSINTNRKFPMFVYESYTSLIKKSDKTAYYYYIGPEDWYINWYIYYINGKIYAAIGDESEYGKGWSTSLSTTKYGIVVSEEKDMVIYNSKNNYFVKGGGILDTSSGMQGSVFPTTTDIYNTKCMKIKVVDEVNAETLDKIAKELSPQYWKVYKKY